MNDSIPKSNITNSSCTCTYKSVCAHVLFICKLKIYQNPCSLTVFISLFFIGEYDSDDIQQFIKESFHMKALNHINVMRLVGVCFDADTTPYIVLPFMAGR